MSLVCLERESHYCKVRVREKKRGGRGRTRERMKEILYQFPSLGDKVTLWLIPGCSQRGGPRGLKKGETCPSDSLPNSGLSVPNYIGSQQSPWSALDSHSLTTFTLTRPHTPQTYSHTQNTAPHTHSHPHDTVSPITVVCSHQ